MYLVQYINKAAVIMKIVAFLVVLSLKTGICLKVFTDVFWEIIFWFKSPHKILQEISGVKENYKP